MSNKPITRKEMFMAKASRENVNTPEPITREEKYLDKIAKNGGKATSWKDLGEKTVMGDTLTWDGNTEGLVVGTIVYNVEEPVNIYRISEVTPSYDEIASSKIDIILNNGDIDYVTPSNIGNDIDGILDADGYFMVVYEDNFTFTNENVAFTFPQKGIYVAGNADFYPASITINGYNGFERTEIVPIPEKYLPVTVIKLLTRFDENGNECYSLDKTFEEIREMLQNYEACVIDTGRRFLEYTFIDEHQICFSAVKMGSFDLTEDHQLVGRALSYDYIVITSDDTVYLENDCAFNT